MYCFSKNSYLLIVLLTLLVSCNKSPTSDKAKISIVRDGGFPISVKIYHFPSFNEMVLGQLELDSGNTSSLELESLRPSMAWIDIGDISNNIFLEQGFDLTISIEGDSLSKKLVFAGNGADVNNYLSQVNAIYNSSERNIIDLELSDFLSRYDSVEQALEKFHREFIKNYQLQSKFNSLVKAINKIHLLKLRMFYTYHYHTRALVDQIYAFRDKKEIKAFIMPDELKDIEDRIPFDTAFFNMGLQGYRNLLAYYIMESKNQYFIVENWDKPNHNLPIESVKRITDANYPGTIKEFFIADNINTWMSEQGITPQIDSLYSDFKRNFSSSIYLADLQKTYEGQIAILPGTVAPDFSGQMITGKVVSLSDFKGKIVYVDVWATWCGPCVEEIPHSIELQSQFKNNREVIFVNLSRDEDLDKWKRFLLKKEQWKGVHINQSTEQSEVTSKDYKVVGYPQYFIIDQAGKIVTAKAPRPSNSSVKRMLEDLLNPM